MAKMRKDVSSVDVISKQVNKKRSNHPNPLVAEKTSIAPSEATVDKNRTFSKWNTSDGNIFTPAHVCSDELPPGVYEIKANQEVGLYFSRINVSMESILKLPDSNSDKVVKEISKFWSEEARFRKFQLTYKRGILLWGPPGSGKTCTIKLIIDDVVKRGGIGLKFCHPDLFAQGLKVLRDIQPDVPVVVLMEDLDSTIETFDESLIINILDGVDRIDKVIFLATTNYPERLGQRIINRPSRFDRRYKIDYPSAEARRVYLNHMFESNNESGETYDIDKWVEDTEDMSLAHLRELFVAVVILNNEYDESLELLKIMSDSIAEEDGKSTGFDLGK